MFELTVHKAPGYLAGRTGIPAAGWHVTPLGGGVSNVVLLAEAGEHRLVLKQSLPELRVAEYWPADRSRIQREWLAMESLGPHLPPGAVPEVLLTDAPNYIFAMAAAPAGAVTWKQQLLDGVIEPAIAERIAAMLGDMLRLTWRSPLWERDFGDLTAFEQLRLDPYHAFTASRHPDLAEAIEASARQARTRRLCGVHGDWSPKNFLVHGDTVTAIDWEVVHFGDPSFDAAFLLNHLLLKMFHRPADAAAYQALAGRFFETLLPLVPGNNAWFPASTARHLGCLLLARVDGKSPAEYLGESERRQVRDFAVRTILSKPGEPLGIFREACECLPSRS